MSEGPLTRYRRMVEAGEIASDPAQALAAEKLQVLANRLGDYGRPVRRIAIPFFERKSSEPPAGLYVYGAVGRGKTMLMDLFFEAVRLSPKRRVHFHEFMGEVQDALDHARKSEPGDPIPIVVKKIVKDARLLCFDELFVTDIADAMILGRLFKGLLEDGVVVVATSNAHPRDLYRDGLNRQLFLPFIDLIEARMEVMELAAQRDYRLEKLAGQPLYFSPPGPMAHASMRAAFERLTGHKHGHPAELEVKGRKVRIPETALGVARFTFAELCGVPLGPRDYVAIAHAFHTLLIEDIPALSPAQRNEARRFVTLIDTLYDNGVCLIASAAAEPGELYPKGDGANLFERTASRLIEMRSEEYLAARTKRGGVAATAAPGEQPQAAK
jgi:cell division protein ZapE